MIQHWRPWTLAAMLGLALWTASGGDVETKWAAHARDIWAHPDDFKISTECDRLYGSHELFWNNHRSSYVFACAVSARPERFCGDPERQRKLARMLKGHFGNLGHAAFTSLAWAWAGKEVAETIFEVALTEVQRQELSLIALNADLLRSVRHMAQQGQMSPRYFMDMASPFLWAATRFVGQHECKGLTPPT